MIKAVVYHGPLGWYQNAAFNCLCTNMRPPFSAARLVLVRYNGVVMAVKPLYFMVNTLIHRN
ncbi:hypothetical protein Kalk_09360 [Ketobacter alkanivorans]|uniref:Uncharacterized protein n=1 Tax=Ketobacter alkanivorans TaxID=1917421 RepID=A0A2K9LK34_9GAMM|nr:hypothetical protein Kalk_09360 [Ketobacter alkanivorans]